MISNVRCVEMHTVRCNSRNDINLYQQQQGVFMRKICLALFIVAMLFVTAIVPANCYSQYEPSSVYTKWGKVTEKGTSRGIPLVAITFSDSDIGYSETVYTNADGYYVWNYHNFCNDKNGFAAKQGFYNKTFKVYDGSCPECFPPDDTRICATSHAYSFSMIRYNQDIDGDGVKDADDNCQFVANGGFLGTCIAGSKRGQICDAQNECGCGSKIPIPCSMSQEDTDSDGWGDACDTTPGLIAMEREEVHEGMDVNAYVQNMKQILPPDQWISMMVIYYCLHNECSFENITEFWKAFTDIKNWIYPFDGYKTPEVEK